MRINPFVSFIFFLFYCSSLFAQDSQKIDNSTKTEVVKKVATIMQEKYVFADTGAKMASFILQQLKDGAYDSFTEIKPFCKQVTSDLRKVSKDKHLFVFFSPDEAKEVAARNNMLPPEEIEKINEYNNNLEKRENYGLKKVEILDGNIGYVDIDYFSDSPFAQEKIVGLMEFLNSTDAIIFDLRNNGGGSGNTVNILMSYFFDTEVEFTGSYFREPDKIIQSWASIYVPGKRLPNVDLYVLTSSRTFSAAEDFSYSLQALKRATIIGENTKGGAHPIDVIIIKGDILTQVAIGNSVNPITGTNWEKVGVKPNIKIDSDKALNKAYKLALEKIISDASDKEYKNQLVKLLNKLNNEQN